MSCFDQCVTVSKETAAQLVDRLELDVDDIGICLACLSFVSMAIRRGDEVDIRREVNRMTPELWEEGLEQPLRLALERAIAADVPLAREALAEVEARGGRGLVAKAVVRRLGQQLDGRAGGDLLKMGFQPWPPRSP
jgi:hypothetical protein